MKFVIVGGGNIGTVLAGELRRLHKDDDVYILTSDKSKWSSSIKIFDENDHFLYESSRINIVEEFIPDADVYFYTLPKHILSSTISKHLTMLTNTHAIFIFLPGTGGVEYLLPHNSNVTFVGLQRVPYIARVKEYGKSAFLLSRKTEIFYAVIGHNNSYEYQDYFGIKAIALHNYLEVTLTPSNPILHTTRLYSLFSDKSINYEYDKNFLFYEEWTDNSSYWLINCDRELQSAIKELKPLDLSMVKSLLTHYEVTDIPSMTNKIKSIVAFHGITSPMMQNNNSKYIVDLNSRYFREDFTYGLLIIKAIAEIANVRTPHIDTVLKWYESISGEQLLDGNNNIIVNNRYNLPQNIGITSIDELIRYYQ